MLKYGRKDLTALQFDDFITGVTSRYDFTGWTLNSEQPSGGITVSKDKVVITKFKPNVPILLSNFTGTGADNTPTNVEICQLTALSQITISGFSQNSSLFVNYEEKNIRRYWSNVIFRGLWYGPVYTYNGANKALPICTDISKVDGSVIKYNDESTEEVGSDGYLRGTGGSYGQFFHVTDKTDTTTPDWAELPSPFYEQAESPYYWWGPGAYWQMGIILFTGATPDANGYITLTSPITLKQENQFIVNPTNIEGYKAYVGEDQVYNKAMTFQNVLMRHGCAFKETGTFTEQIQGANVQITSEYNGESNVAWVISERNYRNDFEHIRLPAISDLGTLIQQSFPFKFWAKLDRDSNYTHIWDSLATAFRNNEITADKFANHLFSTSTGNERTILLRFNVGANNYIDMDGIFDHSTLYSEIAINITSGILKTLHDAFRQTKRLSLLTFNREVDITDFCGAFEGTALENFPLNVFPVDMWPDDANLSEPTCDIHYAADGSALQWFGNYVDQSAIEPEDMCASLVVHPLCKGAFTRCVLSEIKYLLDMKFVSPTLGSICETDGFNEIFGAPDLAVAYIKNLNKGNWVLDGDSSHGVVAGNLENFDEDCANYLLYNVFDLRLNTLLASRLENKLNSFNTSQGWVASDGTKRPVLWETTRQSTLSNQSITSGTMKVRVAMSGCTVSFVNNGQTQSLVAGESTITVNSGTCQFLASINTGASSMSATIELVEPFMSELTQGLTNANLYLPADWETRQIVHRLAVLEANARGWNVYFGGVLWQDNVA